MHNDMQIKSDFIIVEIALKIYILLNNFLPIEKIPVPRIPPKSPNNKNVATGVTNPCFRNEEYGYPVETVGIILLKGINIYRKPAASASNLFLYFLF